MTSDNSLVLIARRKTRTPDNMTKGPSQKWIDPWRLILLERKTGHRDFEVQNFGLDIKYDLRSGIKTQWKWAISSVISMRRRRKCHKTPWDNPLRTDKFTKNSRMTYGRIRGPGRAPQHLDAGGIWRALLLNPYVWERWNLNSGRMARYRHY